MKKSKLFLNKEMKMLTLLYLMFAIIFSIVEYNLTGDFKIFLLASEALSNGENIYERSYIDGFKYFYSPLFAILLTPLTYIPFEVSATLWNLFSFFLLARVFLLISKLYIPVQYKLPKIYLLTFLVSLFPIYANFHMTQMSVFMLYAIFETIYLSSKKHHIVAALLLSFAINIKILPIVFIPYFIYRKEFKLTIYIAVFYLLYLIAPALIIGFKQNAALLSSWMNNLNPMKSQNVIDLSERGFHSITTLFSTLFTNEFNPHEYPLRRHIIVLEENTVGWIINSFRAGLILLTLYFLNSLPFRKNNNPGKSFREVSYLCLIIPLIFPHQQTYGFLFILPAAYYTIHFFYNAKNEIKKTWRHKTALILAIISFLIINLELILGLYRKLFWHYKTLTYGTLILLIVLILCKPRHLKTEIN